ncbi:uncharacterized protein LOC115055325 [Echeneis naucrates]|uniref:uncharacterized protein LOC115055325 n=1 Tax=Echeneis naucrates TaxID=173247 RepID=UPI00111464A3|nr:uncharacterized protein LOC115055325 [Echeneis naucrates]
MGTKKSFWKTSPSQRETPNPSTLQQRRTKALTCVKKKVMTESPSEFSGSAALAESEVSESRQARADHSPHADRRKDISLPNIGHGSSDALLFQPRAFSKKKVNPSSDSEGKQPFWPGHSGQKRQNNGAQLKTNQWLRRQFIAKGDHWDGINAVRKHERKPQEELRKLSVQIWPSRDRLAVFSDVFDDNMLMDQLMESKFLTHDKSLNTSFEDPSSGKLKEK